MMKMKTRLCWADKEVTGVEKPKEGLTDVCMKSGVSVQPTNNTHISHKQRVVT